MKILHVLFTENVGGLERAYVNLHAALQHFGHEVVALAVPKFPFLDEMEGPRFFARPHGAYDFLELIRIYALLWRIRPDLIITHNSRASQIMHLVRKGYPVPMLAFAHSRKCRRLMGADAVCVLTDAMKQQFVAAGYAEDALYVVPNMLTNFPEYPLPVRDSAEPLTLGFMGRFAEVKGLELLLGALAKLHHAGIKLRLRVAGDGEAEQVGKIRRQIAALGLEDSVDLLGWVRDIRGFLAEVDALVVPSLSETFGLVVLEAQAHGRMVLASATDGPSTLIEDGKTGYLFAKGSEDAIVDAMMRALHEREKWGEMVERAREQALVYHPHKVQAQVAHVLNAVENRYGLAD